MAAPTLIMGVVNVTPDSFSVGGRFVDPAEAVAHGLQLVADGADVIDVGGEATNPRATPIPAAEELARILPVIEKLVAAGVVVSVDTTKAVVARAAVTAGARYINDVSGGLFDPDMAAAIGGATYICGHLRGSSLREVFVDEGPVPWTAVAQELRVRLSELPSGARSRAWVDPGIGFGKGSDPRSNLELLVRSGDLSRVLGSPVVVGPSRKRFLHKLFNLTNPTDAELDAATVRVSLEAVRAGARMVRVHNVALLRTALTAYNNK